jgi:hypothetical protein
MVHPVIVIQNCSHIFRECVDGCEDSPFTSLSEELNHAQVCVFTHMYMLRLFYSWNHRIAYACWRFEVFMVVKMHVCDLMGYDTL